MDNPSPHKGATTLTLGEAAGAEVRVLPACLSVLDPHRKEVEQARNRSARGRGVHAPGTRTRHRCHPATRHRRRCRRLVHPLRLQLEVKCSDSPVWRDFLLPQARQAAFIFLGQAAFFGAPCRRKKKHPGCDDADESGTRSFVVRTQARCLPKLGRRCKPPRYLRELSHLLLISCGRWPRCGCATFAGKDILPMTSAFV